MTHYLIARIDINDQEGYSKYQAGFMEIFSQYDGKMLSVDEAPKLIEGEWPVSRTVLIEFPSKESAMAWYESEAYQALAQHRFASSDGNIVLLKGL
jgi:uncharacterized protein (DUF1330 family)|tara:strand:+ start:27 stop:314 length:288 start_codon:yes stop_codon:yes gene_type:complete